MPLAIASALDMLRVQGVLASCTFGGALGFSGTAFAGRGVALGGPSIRVGGLSCRGAFFCVTLGLPGGLRRRGAFLLCHFWLAHSLCRWRLRRLPFLR